MNWVIHGLLANSAAEGQVGLTRGLVTAFLLEILGLVLHFVPLSDNDVAFISTHVGATVALLSFVGFAYLDYALKRIGRK